MQLRVMMLVSETMHRENILTFHTSRRVIMKLVSMLLCATLVMVPVAFGQFFQEDFNYAIGDSLLDHGWNIFGTPSYINSLLVTGPPLAFEGYGLSDHGGATFLAPSGQDLYRPFPSINSFEVYLWMMIKVAGAQYYGDYFCGLASSDLTGTTARLYVKSSSENGFLLGIAKGNEVPAYGTNELTFGETYLVVVKYVFAPGTTTDDVMNLFVFGPGEEVPVDEPPTATVGPYTATSVNDNVDVSYFILRQGASWMAPALVVDGIGISSSWAPALPVQLAYLRASLADGKTVRIDWQTLSETDNLGFTVEKSRDGKAFTPIAGAFIEGHRTTLVPHTYSYTDYTAEPGTWYYRLCQMDGNGATHYSDAVRVEVLTGIAEITPAPFALLQNYPNPFNPTTVVSYQLPAASTVKIVVFDMLGREVTTLVNEQKRAGTHSVTFSENLPSGTYFYRLTATGPNGAVAFTDVKRMTVVK